MNQNSLIKNLHVGFSLIEMLLSVALIGALTVFSAPIYRSLQVKNDLDISSTTVVETLRRAQSLSQAADGDTKWGVKIQSGSIVLFKGTSYAARDSGYDEIFDMSPLITPTGALEITYSEPLGTPQTGGVDITSSITITLTTPYDTKDIVINPKGMISY